MKYLNYLNLWALQEYKNICFAVSIPIQLAIATEKDMMSLQYQSFMDTLVKETTPSGFCPG